MKKVLLSVAALFAAGFVSAQEASTGSGFANGDVFISGAVSFGSEKTGDFKSNQFTVSPKVGYFVSENIAIGVALGYTSMTEDVMSDFDFEVYEQKTNAFEIGAFGRYYFTPSNSFSLFTELGVAYASAKTEMEGVTGELKVNGVAVAFAPGISYFVSDNFALEATFGILGYTTVKPDVDGAESTDTFEIGLDMNDINFGILYKF